jgi:outer membrane protein assembly factor BamB
MPASTIRDIFRSRTFSNPLRFRRRTLIGASCVVFFFGILCFDKAFAGDWPQVLGPNRDGNAKAEEVEAWAGELPVRWRVPCGGGYAGVAVTRGRVFLWHRIDENEILDCLDASDGKRIWRQTFEAFYRGGVDPDIGPRCVPLVNGETVVVYGAGGDMHAVSFDDGAKRWSRALRADYEADEGYFGAGSSPLVARTDAGEDLVVVEVGGETSAGLVALNLNDGKTRWKTLDTEAAYASPVLLDIEGKQYVAALMRLSLFIVDPENGRVRSELPFGRRGPTVNAATPIVDGTQIFLTASYGIGCVKVDVAGASKASLWKDKQVIGSQYATPVRIGNFLYASSGRDDIGVPEMCCVDWRTGKRTWAETGFGSAHLITVGNSIVAQNVDGRVDLIAANSSKYQRLATTKLPAGTYRALPALSDGTLFCRRTESARSGELLAIDLDEKNGR